MRTPPSAIGLTHAATVKPSENTKFGWSGTMTTSSSSSKPMPVFKMPGRQKAVTERNAVWLPKKVLSKSSVRSMLQSSKRQKPWASPGKLRVGPGSMPVPAVPIEPPAPAAAAPAGPPAPNAPPVPVPGPPFPAAPVAPVVPLAPTVAPPAPCLCQAGGRAPP